jgi:arginine N-succinyltransferase
VRESKSYRVGISDQTPAPDFSVKHGLLMVSNRQLAEYRVLLVDQGAAGDDTLWLNPAQAKILNVGEGDTIRAVALRPKEL